MSIYHIELQRHSPPPEPDLCIQEAAQIVDQCTEEIKQLQVLLGLLYDVSENIPARFRIGLSSDIYRVEQALTSARKSRMCARFDLMAAGYDR